MKQEPIQPIEFWQKYRDHIRDTGTQEAYKSDFDWTPIAINAALITINDHCRPVVLR